MALLGAGVFAAQTTPGEPQATDALPGDPFERLDASLRQRIAAVDPSVDGWESEVRASAALEQLERIAGFLEAPGADPAAALAGIAAETFETYPLGSASPEVLFADGAVRVARPGKVFDPVVLEDLGSALESLKSALRGASDVHAKFKIVEVSDVDTGRQARRRILLGPGFMTEALLLVKASRTDGALQINSRWSCSWQAGATGEPPRLQEIIRLDHEEIHGPQGGGTLFADCTEAVLGSNPAFHEQLLPGLPYWRARLDTRLGLPLLGHAAGIAIGDVDGDGLEDLYLCQPGGLPNKLFLHRPDGTAVDRSAESGVDFLDFSRSALLVDLDGDGDRDLAVTVVDKLLLLANDGQAHFWLEAALPAADTTSLAAADIDLDSDLDLYVCAYASPYDHSALPVPYHDANNGRPNVLFENKGDWIFVDATAERGLDQNNRRFSFAAAFEDHDLDGDPDLYVANDFGRNNLYRNDGGKFVDVAAAAGVEDVSAGMGVTWGDHDGDGRFDLYVSNMYSSAGNRIAYQRRFQQEAEEPVRALYRRHAHGNTLFRNSGDGTFADVTEQAGVAMGRWAWGALFLDLNSDGWQDLFSPNGFITEERSEDL